MMSKCGETLDIQFDRMTVGRQAGNPVNIPEITIMRESDVTS
jgi:hypothetical protein